MIMCNCDNETIKLGDEDNFKLLKYKLKSSLPKDHYIVFPYPSVDDQITISLSKFHEIMVNNICKVCICAVNDNVTAKVAYNQLIKIWNLSCKYLYLTIDEDRNIEKVQEKSIGCEVCKKYIFIHNSYKVEMSIFGFLSNYDSNFDFYDLNYVKAAQQLLLKFIKVEKSKILDVFEDIVAESLILTCQLACKVIECGKQLSMGWQNSLHRCIKILIKIRHDVKIDVSNFNFNFLKKNKKKALSYVDSQCFKMEHLQFKLSNDLTYWGDKISNNINYEIFSNAYNGQVVALIIDLDVTNCTCNLAQTSILITEWMQRGWTWKEAILADEIVN